MRAYRLIKAQYAPEPLDPQGAKRHGGRWNSKGMPVVYASDTIALAAFEKLVHLHRADVLNHFVLYTLSFGDDLLMTLAQDALPPWSMRSPLNPSSSMRAWREPRGL